jgi:hypothetical protein
MDFRAIRVPKLPLSPALDSVTASRQKYAQYLNAAMAAPPYWPNGVIQPALMPSIHFIHRIRVLGFSGHHVYGSAQRSVVIADTLCRQCRKLRRVVRSLSDAPA